MIYITFISEILPLIFCILFYKKLNTKALKVFFIYTIVLASFAIIGTISLYLVKSKDLYLLTVKLYTLAEYILFAILLNNFYINKIAKKIVLFSIIPFTIFCLINYYITKSSYSNYPLLIEFLSFIVFIIYFFYEKMKTVVSYPLYQSISFWICVGLFLYFTGNFFFLLFSSSSTDKNFTHQMKVIYSLVTITKNILLSFSFFATEFIESNEDSLNLPSELDLDSFYPNNNLN